MKLYCHPGSTTSRTVMLFAAEAGIPVELQVVERFAASERGSGGFGSTGQR